MKRLEIGCGRRPTKGYDHLDIKDIPNIRYPNVDARSLPIDDQAYDEVFSQWTLEHFGRREIVDVLREWGRVLRDGGLLRLIANDQEAINACLSAGEISWQEWNLLTFGGNTSLLEDCHKIGLTRENVQRFLKEAGFKQITVKATKRCRGEHGGLKCPGLIIEATK